MSLTFLEASKIAAAANELGAETFVLAASGQTEKLDVFIKAISIQKGFNSHYTTLPFNTLQQYIATPVATKRHHVFILFPWDLIPEADWRSGVARKALCEEGVRSAAESFIARLKQFPSKSILYVPAPMLPITSNLTLFSLLELHMRALLLEEGAQILSADYFSLSSYLSNGCAFSGKYLFGVSNKIVGSIPKQYSVPKKILVTDFDNVMWRGVVGEDGVEGIQCSSDGAGYIHFIYQSYLLRLKSEGILIAGVTRNDAELAEAPFNQGKTLFGKKDFVSLLASYNPKSAQIKALCRNLNIASDSVVFIDDNPLELEEVSKQLPAVECLRFPERNEEMPQFFSQLQRQFNITRITAEDKKRTELYKTRFKAIEVSSEAGADLSGYLHSLEMKLTVIKCDASNYERSLQLINKTNQFNLNGVKINDEQASDNINNGAQLYSFSLADKFGDHGEVCTIMVFENKVCPHFVMSCRVFQRRVEYAVLLLVAEYLSAKIIAFSYKATAKNIPFQNFIDDDAFTLNDDLLVLDVNLFKEQHQAALDLFHVDVLSRE